MIEFLNFLIVMSQIGIYYTLIGKRKYVLVRKFISIILIINFAIYPIYAKVFGDYLYRELLTNEIITIFIYNYIFIFVVFSVDIFLTKFKK
jgi:hypothetical protein